MHIAFQQELDDIAAFDKRRIALDGLVKDAKSKKHFAHRVGDAMPNEGVILQQELLHRMSPGTLGDEYLVLAMIPGHYHNFVVWRRCVGTGQRATGGYDLQDYCYSGHYCKTLVDALMTWDSLIEQSTIEGDA